MARLSVGQTLWAIRPSLPGWQWELRDGLEEGKVSLDLVPGSQGLAGEELMRKKGRNGGQWALGGEAEEAQVLGGRVLSYSATADPPCYLWELTPRLFQALHTDLRPPHAPSFQRQVAATRPCSLDAPCDAQPASLSTCRSPLPQPFPS